MGACGGFTVGVCVGVCVGFTVGVCVGGGEFTGELLGFLVLSFLGYGIFSPLAFLSRISFRVGQLEVSWSATHPCI